MRAPTRHVQKSGDISYKVRFRLNGSETSITFAGPPAVEATTEDEATRFARMIDAIGPAAALDWQRQQDEREHKHSHLTMSMLVDDWVDTRTKASAETRLGYQQTWNRTFGPIFGDRPVTAVDWRAIAKAVNQLASTGGRNGAGLSAKSLSNAMLPLNGAFQVALRDGIVSQNPCDEVELPDDSRHDVQEMYLFSLDECYELLSKLPKHWSPLVQALAGTGIRWGEAEALEVGDVSLDNAILRITKAAKWNGSRGKREIGPPKTKHGKRSITLPPQTVEALEPIVSKRKKRERLFKSPRTNQITHKPFWQDIWVPTLEKIGLIDPRPRIHDLRHSHASWLIAAGVPLAVISRRLGHANIGVTVDTYGHLSPDVQRAAADAAGFVFSQPRLTPLVATTDRPVLRDADGQA